MAGDELAPSAKPTLDKQYDPTGVEKEIYELWERSGAFRAHPADPPTPHDNTFTIVIPPPNVTGALHLGHALNNTLQDILIRYHRMRGFNTLWQPGTDHAGIATQAVVERRIRELEGKTRHEIGREELVRRIWQWKDEYETRIINQLKLIGCSCDWERTRFTLDEGLSKAVRHMFFKLFRDGLIFRGKRLVNWDTQLQTAVSDDEVYYETVKGHFWHFRYPVIDPKPGEPEYVIIATTRPETMLGDTAVAVHPDPEGFFDKQETVLRESLEKATGKDKTEIERKLEALANRRVSHLGRLVTLRDMAKDGRMVLLPLVERRIPLICDEWADPTKGSGCVKITPAHDPNDYEVGVRHDLPMINVLTPDGKVAPIIEADPAAAPTKPGSLENMNSDRYAGLSFSGEGRDKVLADLEARGLIHAIEDHEHEIGHSDRSKLPIEPYLSDQWFIKTGDIIESRAQQGSNVPDVRAESGVDGEPRTSVRAAHRTPDLSTGAVLITWTTFGTWLPGDERGFVSRIPETNGSHILHNLPGEPYDADEPEVRSAAMQRMKGKPVYLDKNHARTVLRSIAATCERHGIEPLAVAIMRNHVHVLCQTDLAKPELLKLFKGAASRELNTSFSPTIAGGQRWWTKSGSVRYVKRGSDLTSALDYLLHQEHPLYLWSFDKDTGDAAKDFGAATQQARSSLDAERTARTEVRGSLGITLPDGSRVPGLAQAAMDAVKDGRINVLPPRYAKSYLDWLGEKRDWCISRQLWWGHRIPVWSCRFSSEGTAALMRGHEGMPERERCALDLFNSWTKQNPNEVVGNLGEPGLYTAGISTETRAKVIEERKKGTTIVTPIPVIHVSVLRLCLRDDVGGMLEELETNGYQRDSDVLDTWFSSALWPFSTLGWPDDTPHVRQYYPGSVLCTSRDIVTNWVARMVMFGLYAMGDVPFDHVYIHPKILDGRGETMSKSKGNGVDPVDIIHTHGADALRYTMADMTTETQDIRMPVEYLCPHCGRLTHQEQAIKAETQARKSRGQKLTRKLQPSDCHRVTCTNNECGKTFATQWADAATKGQLGLGRETSEKFDIGRNFCNKLWNAARFAFPHLEGAPCQPLAVDTLPPEDRWILAKLSQTIRRYHESLRDYRFSASVKELREFFWDSLCDWYIELTKPRLGESQPSVRADSENDSEPPVCVPRTGRRTSVRADSGNDSEPRTSVRADIPDPSASTKDNHDPARQILAFCLDQILRLWHPTMPFITERLWSQLNRIAPKRGLPGIADLQCDDMLILAEFPPVEGYPALEDEKIIATFAGLQDATRGVRELRAECEVSPKEKVTVTVVVPADHLDAFRSQAHILRHMAHIGELKIADRAQRPKNAGSITAGHLRIYVHDISDDEAERKRTAGLLEQLEKQIAAKEKKLSNEKFVTNAKPEIVEAERQRLSDLLTQRDTLKAHLDELL